MVSRTEVLLGMAGAFFEGGCLSDSSMQGKRYHERHPVYEHYQLAKAYIVI